MTTKVKRVGWHWFLPDENCPTPTGLLRLDKPVVVLVGTDKQTHDGKKQFVVRFPTVMMDVDDLSGEWEEIRPPKRMQKLAMKRIQKKRQANADE